jgi:hypothetical protein
MENYKKELQSVFMSLREYEKRLEELHVIIKRQEREIEYYHNSNTGYILYTFAVTLVVLYFFM